MRIKYEVFVPFLLGLTTMAGCKQRGDFVVKDKGYNCFVLESDGTRVQSVMVFDFQIDAPTSRDFYEYIQTGDTVTVRQVGDRLILNNVCRRRIFADRQNISKINDKNADMVIQERRDSVLRDGVIKGISACRDTVPQNKGMQR